MAPERPENGSTLPECDANNGEAKWLINASRNLRPPRSVLALEVEAQTWLRHAHALGHHVWRGASGAPYREPKTEPRTWS
jgi:hypothetical protein